MTAPAWLERLVDVVRCDHIWTIRGDGDGIVWLECFVCGRRSVGWTVHAPRRRPS